MLRSMLNHLPMTRLQAKSLAFRASPAAICSATWIYISRNGVGLNGGTLLMEAG